VQTGNTVFKKLLPMNFSILFANDIKVFFPEIFLTFAILIVLIYGVFIATSITYNYPLVSRNIYFLVLFILSLCFLLTLQNPVDFSLVFQKTFVQDDLSRIAKLVILGPQNPKTPKKNKKLINQTKLSFLSKSSIF
jgi:hypothetical protein